MALGPWQDILDQHISIVTLLETHAALLVDSMPQHSTGEGSAQRLLETRLQKTEGLISFFKESAAALGEISSVAETNHPQSPVVVPNSQPAKPSQPTMDSSGLFSVDTNPTPVEYLYRPSANEQQPPSRGSKRKVSDLEAPFEAIGLSEYQPTHKRARSHERNDLDGQEADDSFERGVDAKLKAKAERKKTRENKKRKRGSDTSSIRANVKGPKNKKQKQVHERKVESQGQKSQGPRRQNNGSKRSNAEASNGATQPSKKRKKSR